MRIDTERVRPSPRAFRHAQPHARTGAAAARPTEKRHRLVAYDYGGPGRRGETLGNQVLCPIYGAATPEKCTCLTNSIPAFRPIKNLVVRLRAGIMTTSESLSETLSDAGPSPSIRSPPQSLRIPRSSSASASCPSHTSPSESREVPRRSGPGRGRRGRRPTTPRGR